MRQILCTILLAAATTGYAQKIKLVEGSLAPLKGEKALKTEFVYSPMSVGKFDKEEEYVAQKIKDYNEKEAGQGDKWAEKWKSDRKDRFEPQFRELFSKTSEMSTVGESAKYTLIFHTTKTEPGFNIGITRSNAYINADVLIVESANHDKVIARITIEKAPGRDAMGYDFETGARLEQAYAKAGKDLGAFIKKNAK